MPQATSSVRPARSRAAGRAAPRFYIDVSPLQEPEYTGIPQVAAKLCEELLGDAEVEPAFFYGRYEAPVWLVEHLLKQRSGSLLRAAAGRTMFEPILSPYARERLVWAMHCNAKSARRLFPVEGQMIYDLTTLVTPEYHSRDVGAYYQSKFYGDIMSSELLISISESTAADVRHFYPDAKNIPHIVAHLGVDWTHVPPEVREEDLDVEPFVFVLGTLEPRKNVEGVLAFLEADPGFCDRYRVVFSGRIGWGDAFETRLEARGLTKLAAAGRILQTGFITEVVKYRLLKHAKAVIYPSVYEGFGLPVAEAISLGVPVVTTPSSSLPEVGRDFAHYFDPDLPGSLATAIEAALAAGSTHAGRSGETLEAWSRRFTWPACYRTIRDAFLACASPAEAMR